MDYRHKTLIIGGTGVISSACVQEAVLQGHDVTVLNRGTAPGTVPYGVRTLTADIRNPAAVQAALGARKFDSIINFVAFTEDHVRADIELFRGRTAQYVLISSASAYQTPPRALPITESTPLCNPFLQYSRSKIAAESELLGAYRDEGFPATIVRPSHTYGPTKVPLDGGWTVIQRMREGKEVIVHGDGTSLWTLTHRTDFARSFLPLLGNPRAIGDAFHITSDEVLTWNQIYEALAEAAGAEAKIVHVPSDAIARADEKWGAALLGDKAHSLIFDNSKIRAVSPATPDSIPFWQGAREIISWHDADPSRRTADPQMEETMDALISTYGR